jgi:hypothetical protein
LLLIGSVNRLFLLPAIDRFAFRLFCPQRSLASFCCHTILAETGCPISLTVIKNPFYMKKFLTAVFGKLVLGSCLILTVATAQAQTIVPGSGQSESATVKYLGTQDDMIVFNVSYANPEGSKFQLSIKDQDGTQLYQNIFNEKTFYKQFRLPKADKDRIVFVIRNGKDADMVKSFEVNVNSRFIQEIAVKKLNN